MEGSYFMLLAFGHSTEVLPYNTVKHRGLSEHAHGVLRLGRSVTNHQYLQPDTKTRIHLEGIISTFKADPTTCLTLQTHVCRTK